MSISPPFGHAPPFDGESLAANVQNAGHTEHYIIPRKRKMLVIEVTGIVNRRYVHRMVCAINPKPSIDQQRK